MATAADNVKLPALGRYFQLGSLYDMRREDLYHGRTLWAPKQLDQAKTSTKKEGYTHELLCEKNLTETFKSVGLEGGLMISFLMDMLEVEGSAKYVKEKRAGRNVSRVTLQCRYIGRYDSLDMSRLAKTKMANLQELDINSVTHIVCAIEYGVQAFLMLESDVEISSTRKEVQAELAAKISSELTGVGVGGGVKGGVEFGQGSRELASKLACKYIGDFAPDKNPTTYKEAIKFYRDLPSKVKSCTPVPITVWLYPVHKLEQASAKLYRDLSPYLTTKIQELIISMEDFLAECDIMLKTDAARNVVALEMEIKKVQLMVNRYKLALKEQIKTTLLSIRKAYCDESALENAIKKHKERPFTQQKLNAWLTSKNHEVELLDGYFNLLTNVKFVKSTQELEREVVSLDKDEVICLELSLGQELNPWVSECEMYLMKKVGKSKSSSSDPTHWMEDEAAREQMRKGFSRVKPFVEANRKRDYVKFLVYTISELEIRPYAKINLYKQGKQFMTDYIPPSQPKNIKVQKLKKNPTKLWFEWDAPKTNGNPISRYRILWRRGKDSEWQSTYTPDSTTTLVMTNFSPNTSYAFLIAGECKVGRTPDSELLDVRMDGRLLPATKAANIQPAEDFRSERPPAEDSMELVCYSVGNLSF